MKPTDGTRYELVLESSTGASRAVYRATVYRPEGEASAQIEITPTGSKLVAGGEGMDPAATTQVLAIAKTLGKRADEGGWPRRIYRWRKPGVR